MGAGGLLLLASVIAAGECMRYGYDEDPLLEPDTAVDASISQLDGQQPDQPPLSDGQVDTKPPPPDAKPPPPDAKSAKDSPPPDPDLKLPDSKPPPDSKPLPDAPAGPALSSHSPLIAASPGGFGVVWRDNTNTPSIQFRMVDAMGKPKTAAIKLSTGYAYSSNALEWNGSDFTVLFSQTGHHFARIKESGALVVPPKKLTSQNAWARLVRNGASYGLAWRESKHVKFQRLNADGVPQGAELTLYTAPLTGYANIGTYRSPMMAYGDGYFGVVFAVKQSSTSSIQGPLYFTRVSAAGVQTGGVTQLAAGSIKFPSIGHGINNFVVSWHTSGGPTVLRVNATTGAVVGSATALGGDSYCDHAPMMSLNALQVQVWTAFAGSNGVGFVTLNPGTGLALYGPKVVLSRKGLRHPWIAPRNPDFGLVWGDVSLGTTEVFFSRVSSSGSAVGTPVRISDL